MSLVKLNKALKKINNKKNLIRETCTSAELFISKNTIELRTNGMPLIVSIAHSGNGLFSSSMPVYIKLVEGNGKLIINNVFKKEMPEKILSFFGNPSISACVIFSQDGSKIKATINNMSKLSLIGSSKTNLEDENLILFEEPRERKIPIPISGISRKLISKSSFNSQGKVQKYGKREIEDISSLITELASPSVKKTRLTRYSARKPVAKAPIKKVKKLGGKY